MTASRRYRVLWVDDEPSLLQVVSRTLRFFGDYEVHLAGTGIEALEKIRQQPVDCVGTNIKMEPMDGVAMAQSIHAQHPTLPVIVLTALASGWRAAEQAGASDYMCKPFDLDDLVTSVSHAVRWGASWRSDRLRGLPWRERASTAQAVIERAGEQIEAVAEACMVTPEQLMATVEEGKVFSQTFTLVNSILPSQLREQGAAWLETLDRQGSAVIRAAWHAAGKGRKHSQKELPAALSGVVTDYPDGARIGIVTLPGPMHQGEAFLSAVVSGGVTEGIRLFALEFQIRKNLASGVLVERILDGSGVRVVDADCPVDIDTFYERIGGVLNTVEAGTGTHEESGTR